MARKSRYQETAAQKPDAKVWSTALYVRLSREDGDKSESESIIAQRELLLNFIEKNSDLALYDIYIDDGYTGTNFERPSFRRMIADITDKAIDCVAVKDLSRFGRNYIETGKYIETFFPLMGVRFISVNDSVDSVKNPGSTNDIMIPFKNIINDEYCRDISKKVRSSLDIRRANGKFIGSFACYGYIKNPNDHNKLLVDPEAAETIRLIYRLFLSGKGMIAIAKTLNRMGIPNPSTYKRSKGLNYKHPAYRENDGLWCDATVRRILKNEMLTGVMVQGVNRTISYKVQVSKPVDRADWVKVPDTHEAIIDRATFDTVQGLLKRDTRTPPQKEKVGLFAGFLKCADCGKAMNKKLISQPNRDYHYFVCSTFKKSDRNACTKHTIRSDKLEQAVLTTLQSQIAIAVSMDEVITAINENGKRRKVTEQLETLLQAKRRERGRCAGVMNDLYPDWKAGMLNQEQYLALRERYESELRKIDAALADIEERINKVSDGVDESNEFVRSFKKYRNIQHLTREVLIELVENIYVHEGGEITIALKYRDAFEDAAQYIEKNADALGTA
ncbi:MAG: recombinase family protein [bacterium]|nr:recombinase family protein [bacterium]